MGKEIERKFLVIEPFPSLAGIKIQQFYLSLDLARIVRVRISGDEAMLTIKGALSSVERMEFEYAIPINEARALMDLRVGAVIQKTRYKYFLEPHVWEIDVFEDENDGLIVAEIELGNVSESFDTPPFVGLEVSNDPRYGNSALAVHPFSKW